MFSDVPSDGYSVELGKLEPNAQRGQILATGQRIRFIFAAISGLIQMFLLNGPTTNAPDSPDAWSWGLTMQSYYGLLFAITLVLVLPIFYFKEVRKIHKITGEVSPPPPAHSLTHFMEELWVVLQNQTTLSLLIYVIMFQSFGSIANQANVYVSHPSLLIAFICLYLPLFAVFIPPRLSNLSPSPSPPPLYLPSSGVN